MLQIISLVLLALNVINYFVFNEGKKLRYRHWYRPVLFLIFALIAIAFEPKFKSILVAFFPSSTFVAELLFCSFVVTIWIIVKSLLQLLKANDSMEAFLRKYNTNKVIERHRGFDNYLVWPYKILGFEVYRREGFVFFKILLWIALVALIVAFWWAIVQSGNVNVQFYSGIGAMLITLLVEGILYFQCSITEKEKKQKGCDSEEEENIDFLRLFRRYMNNETGFFDSVITGFVKRNTTQKNDKEIADSKLLAQKYVKELSAGNQDFIVASSSFLEHIPYFSELFFNTLKQGGNILLLADIPVHTKYRPAEVGLRSSSNRPEAISKLFATYLQNVIEKEIPTAKSLIDIGYFDAESDVSLEKRIMLCSVDNANSDALIHSKWVKELSLVVVFQFYDNYSNNLILKRQLSRWLDQQEIRYNTVFFKIYRAGGDESVTNTWMTVENLPEARMKNVSSAKSNLFINFASEKSEDNLRKLLQGSSHEYDLSPGMELSVFAIMENLKHIHFFEGYNLDYIQSKNKLEGLQQSFIREENNPDSEHDYGGKVSQEKIKDSVFVNNLPFIVYPSGNRYCQDKHLSIVFDVENNAPKLYQKYRHLGKEEDFVCIVSKPHLFRDFFASKMNYFVDVTLEALEPSLSQNKVNLCLQLLHLLMHEKIEINYLKSLINLHAVQFDGNVVLLIKELFARYLDLDITGSSMLKSSEEYIFKNGEYRLSQTLTIDKQAIESRRFFDAIRTVKVVDSNDNTILRIPKYLLFQNFLPQQNIIINGTSYRYNQYNDTSKELSLSPYKTDNVVFYKPQAVVSLTNEMPPTRFDSEEQNMFIVGGQRLSFSLNMFETPMELYYTSYFSFEKFYQSPVSNKAPKKKELSPDFIDQSKRKYITRFLHLKWEISAEFEQSKDLITTQLHLLLYEFMPVLFPYYTQYIQIASDNKLKKELRELTPWIYPENNFKYDESGNFIEIYIVEDSFADLGVLKSIKIHFETIVKHLYDLLKWLNDKDSNDNVGGYVEYIKGGALSVDKLSFLTYGVPDKFEWDIELLIRFIKNNAFFDTTHIDDNYNKMSKEIGPSLDVECDYCRKTIKMSEVEVMEDGLHRCSSCAIDAVDTLEKALKLEVEAKRLYKELLNIDFMQLKYEFKFVTATELHDYYGKPFNTTHRYDKREAIGLASDRDIDVIHVEKFWKASHTLSTIVHEMMHIYQYQKLNYFKIKNSENELIEGMTRWAEYYLLVNSGVPEYIEVAKALHDYSLTDESKYGVGYRYVLDKYGDDLMAKVNKKYAI